MPISPLQLQAALEPVQQRKGLPVLLGSHLVPSKCHGVTLMLWLVPSSGDK